MIKTPSMAHTTKLVDPTIIKRYSRKTDLCALDFDGHLDTS